MKALIFTIAITLMQLPVFAQKEGVDKETVRFLTVAAEARMMDREEGKLAAERGTTAEIREYGNLMVKDQTSLLAEIEKLAAVKKVILPKTIGTDKADALKDLKEKTGKDFDKMFLRMIKIDHKRDVKEFKNATEYDDKEVKSFAIKRLSLIEKHLSGVEKIKETM